MAPGEYVAVVATHQAELGAGTGRRRRGLHGLWILRERLGGEERKKREEAGGSVASRGVLGFCLLEFNVN